MADGPLHRSNVREGDGDLAYFFSFPGPHICMLQNRSSEAGLSPRDFSSQKQQMS